MAWKLATYHTDKELMTKDINQAVKEEVEKDLILLRILLRRHHDLPHARLPCRSARMSVKSFESFEIVSRLVTRGRAGEVADEVVEQHLQHRAHDVHVDDNDQQ